MLDPSFAQAHFALAQALCSLDQHKEAMREINIAIKLSPRDPHMWTFLHIRALAHYIADNLDQAEADERAALRLYPYTVLVAVLGRKSSAEKANDAVAELLRVHPGFTCQDAIDEWHLGDHPFATRRFLDQFATDIRKSGLPE